MIPASIKPLAGRPFHERPRSHGRPDTSRPPEPSDRRRRRPLAGVRAGHARGVPAHRRRGGRRGPGDGDLARAELAHDVGGRAAAGGASGQEAFWSSPSENVLDRATAMLPRLMYERLDDLGIDFSVVYPTAGLGYHRMQDTRLRRAICRAYNVFTADQFRGLRRPHHPGRDHPDVHAGGGDRGARVRGHSSSATRSSMVGGMMRRPVPALAEEQPEASKLVEWYDVIGLDSPHDYDPVWAQVPRAASWRRASTTARARSCCATRRRTSATTTSATSPPPATPWPRPSSSAASPGASPT